MTNLTIDIEQEDQRGVAQDFYHTLSVDQISVWLNNAVKHLVFNLSVQPLIYSAVAKEILTHFSDFYLAIIFVDSQKSQALNHEYRQKNKPTNILSFPSPIPLDFYKALPKEEQQFTLGDLVIDLSLIKKEAEEQDKKERDHLAHILIHGLLHLFNFDHESDDEALIMESLEIELLNNLGIINPYASH